jgi:hypothetical protein
MPRKSPPETKEKIQAFFAAYAATCNIVGAARKAGISRTSHYRWLAKPNYREAFTRAQHLAREYLESELVKRATKGWTEPIFYQGAQCGTVRRFDGATGMALLRGMWPEKYGTQRQEISGPQGTPIQAKIEVVFVRPSSGLS